jgi:IS5 family transposase
MVHSKEFKKVASGAKVNMIQVDGINFIEHLSFDAFNEGPRLIDSIWYIWKLFGKITHIYAGDIHANNANRKWYTEHKITTNFKRNTDMEDSFGTEKQHFVINCLKLSLFTNYFNIRR